MDDVSAAVRFTQLEDMLNRNAEQLSSLSGAVEAARKAALEATEALSRRVALLEISTRALEDRALAEKIIATERDRIAVRAAQGQLSRRTLWLGVTTIALGNLFTVVGALIAGHVI